MDQGFLDSLTGSASVDVLVENTGQDGDVEVVVELEDNQGNTLTREIESTHMNEDAQETVTVDLDGSSAAESYHVEARAG